LRHPEPAGTEGLCYGHLDVALKPDWRDQLAPVLRWLERGEQSLLRIVSSPSRRCREPALWLSGRLGIPIRIEARLMELDFGAWEGLSWTEIDGPESRAWSDDFVERAPPGGERFADLATRVRAAYAEWIRAGGGTLFVCHGGPIRVLLADAGRLPLNRAFERNVAYAELLELSDPR
jgi:alpha-ribazole phosphatase